ncbi:MAG: DMT family transporter, partial [Macromonas bipunctata]|nr:DMT family transporter [Macromonas bipunctata]
MPSTASQTAAATLPPVVADRAATTPPVPAFNRQALWMVLGAFFFASMGVCIKFASAHFSSYEVVGYRGLIGVLFLAVTMRARGVAWRTPVPLMHAGRSVAGVAALLCWFYAISVLPLATSMTLNYMSSVWMAVFVLGAAFIVKKSTSAPLRQQWPLLLAVLLGFAGVVLLLRPTLAPGQAWGAGLGLLSGL